jgi:hypothetical protein
MRRFDAAGIPVLTVINEYVFAVDGCVIVSGVKVVPSVETSTVMPLLTSVRKSPKESESVAYPVVLIPEIRKVFELPPLVPKNTFPDPLAPE